MNLKIASALFFLVGFMNSQTVENVGSKTIKYSEITTQLIEAETLDDAKVILNKYDTIDQNILREHLLTRQNLWFAQHGLYDKVAFQYTMNEMLKYSSPVISVVSLSLSALIFFTYIHGFGGPSEVEDLVKSAVTGTLFGFIALGSIHDSPILRKQINEFHRIKALLICVG